jgi:hypothetical protein
MISFTLYGAINGPNNATRRKSKVMVVPIPDMGLE